MRPNFFKKPIRKRFIDAFPKFKKEAGDTENYFWETWQSSPFYISTLTETDLHEIYNHLCAAYYNWHFIYPDDYGIAMNVFHVVHEYFPNVKIRLGLAASLRDLTIDEFKDNGHDIQSSAQNPRVESAMDEVLDYLDSQITNFSAKSEEQAIKAKFYALRDGIMDEFIDRFNYMFVKQYNGVADYIYTDIFDEEEEE